MKTIEVSDETYEKIKDQIEADKKKEFEPIKGCKFNLTTRKHRGSYPPMVLNLRATFAPDHDCSEWHIILSIDDMEELIQALQKGKAFVQANK